MLATSCESTLQNIWALFWETWRFSVVDSTHTGTDLVTARAEGTIIDKSTERKQTQKNKSLNRPTIGEENER